MGNRLVLCVMKLQGLKWPSTGKLLDKCDDGGEIRFYEDRKEVNEYLERDTTVKVDIVMQLGIKFAVASLMDVAPSSLDGI